MLRIEHITFQNHFRRGGVLVFLLWIFASQLVSQVSPPVIDRIEIEGNERTRTEYLERFIKMKAGSSVDSLLIENDLRRLRTLAGVGNVRASVFSFDTISVLRYHITERYTLLPVGDFGITEDNFWVGGGAMESNLTGRGIYVYGFYRYNGNHAFHMIYRDPYVLGSKWGSEIQIKRFPTLETTGDSIEILNLFFDVSAAVRYEFRYENDLLAGLSYREQSYRYKLASDEEIAKDPATERNSIVPFASWELSRLDYHDFYVSGWRNTMHAEMAIPVAGAEKLIFLFHEEFRFYTRLGKKGNFASRILLGFSNEDQTLFSPFIADSYYNFRGIGYRVAKGNAVGLINLEYRFTLYENKLGGIQSVIFSDTGFLAKSADLTETRMMRNTFHSFAGPGLRLIYKKAYNAVLSIDYGFNLQDLRHRGWVVGWGQYF